MTWTSSTPHLRVIDGGATTEKRISALWVATRNSGFLLLLLLMVILFGALLPVPACGQDAVPPGAELDVLAAVKAIVVAVQSGQWPVAVVLAFVVAIAVLKKYGAAYIPWLKTSEGGTVLALAVSVAGVLGAAAFAGTPITWALLWVGVKTGFGTIGGYLGMRRLLRALSPYVAKIPKVGPPLARVIDVLAGADAKAEIAKETDANYKPLSPAPDAQTAADALSKPPVP
jgi:hypothetical protein